jgi:aquaporin Z
MSTMRLKQSQAVLSRQFVAEALGTMFLAATAGMATISHFGLLNGYNSLYIPFAIGGVVMLLVYLLGSVSGAHLNPAVTVALFTFRKITVTQLVSYLIAQFMGAWLGIQLVIKLIGIPPTEPEALHQAAGIGEFVGTFLIAMTITTVVLGKIKQEMAGLVIGLAFVVALTLTMATGAGFINPAVAMAFGAPFGIIYFLMPLLGGIVGAAAAVLFNVSEE